MAKVQRAWLASAAMLLWPACALGSDGRLTLDPYLAYQSAQAPESTQEQGADEPVYDESAPPDGRLAFGEAGSWYWMLGGGVGLSGDSIDSMAQAGVGTFLTDDLEFNLTFRGWYFAQDDGDDAGGGSFAIGFRWHFVQRERYSVYAHAGIGLLQASDDVPPDGTKFNFTPTVGVGSTVRLGESATRLDVGARWHHISNATSSGSDDNPARDGIMLYVGLIFPF